MHIYAMYVFILIISPSDPWSVLVTYGPVGVISSAALWALKIWTDTQREKDKQALEQTGSLITRLQKRDEQHETALQKICDSLDRLADRLDNVANRTDKSNLLIAALARIVSTTDGRRISEREIRDLIRSINEELKG